jgi:hypothetical protein
MLAQSHCPPALASCCAAEDGLPHPARASAIPYGFSGPNDPGPHGSRRRLWRLLTMRV